MSMAAAEVELTTPTATRRADSAAERVLVTCVHFRAHRNEESRLSRAGDRTDGIHIEGIRRQAYHRRPRCNCGWQSSGRTLRRQTVHDVRIRVELRRCEPATACAGDSGRTSG